MRATRRSWSVLAGIILSATILGVGPSWSKGTRSKESLPALWIAADRVVGFVPFTVSLYGKVTGNIEPGRLELCRDLAIPPDLATARPGADDPVTARSERNGAPAGLPEPSCSTGTLMRTQDGFDYRQEMRFDRPGTYRVRLTMVDATGHRAISNAVQVNAL
jgi:hypothetical protein